MERLRQNRFESFDRYPFAQVIQSLRTRLSPNVPTQRRAAFGASAAAGGWASIDLSNNIDAFSRRVSEPEKVNGIAKE